MSDTETQEVKPTTLPHAKEPDIKHPSPTENYLASQDVKIVNNPKALEKHPEFLQHIGFIPQNATDISIDVITDNFFDAHHGQGFFRGGGESFYKVIRVTYRAGGQDQTRTLAEKSIHGMGEIRTKTLSEALRLTLLSTEGLAPRVFAVGNGTIYKEWLEADESPPSDQEEILDKLGDQMKKLGIYLAVGRELKQMTLFNNGEPKVFDAGSGDLRGPNPDQLNALINKTHRKVGDT